jgi:hypothetical protein
MPSRVAILMKMYSFQVDFSITPSSVAISVMMNSFCCHALNPPVPSHSQHGGGLDDGEQFLGGLLDHSQ